MIHWIFFFLKILAVASEYLFNIFLMLTLNLPIILISRGLFVLAFYFNYIKFAEKYSEKDRLYIFSTKEKFYFLGKNVAVILLSFLNFYICLFFATYSLLCASNYFKNIAKREEKKRCEEIGNILYMFTPFILMIICFIIGDLYAIISIFIALTAFIYRGQKYSNYSLQELFERYNKRIMRRIPITLQIVIILLLIVPPIILFLGLYLTGLYFFEGLFFYLQYLFNINLMLWLNLPIIGIALILYFYSFRLKFLKSSERAAQNEINNDITKKIKAYLVIKSILIVILSFFFIYLALFFAVYFLLISAVQFEAVKRSRNDDFYNILKILSLTLIPV
ncbi:MAG: hypothetical protein ACTSQS_16065, partial [Promethearchaeota archaeon]